MKEKTSRNRNIIRKHSGRKISNYRKGRHEGMAKYIESK